MSLFCENSQSYKPSVLAVRAHIPCPWSLEYRVSDILPACRFKRFYHLVRALLGHRFVCGAVEYPYGRSIKGIGRAWISRARNGNSRREHIRISGEDIPNGKASHAHAVEIESPIIDRKRLSRGGEKLHGRLHVFGGPGVHKIICDLIP